MREGAPASWCEASLCAGDEPRRTAVQGLAESREPQFEGEAGESVQVVPRKPSPRAVPPLPPRPGNRPLSSCVGRAARPPCKDASVDRCLRKGGTERSPRVECVQKPPSRWEHLREQRRPDLGTSRVEMTGRHSEPSKGSLGGKAGEHSEAANVGQNAPRCSRHFLFFSTLLLNSSA